ncbi:MAG: (Fe-S)-binding protein [Blastocatellia bacterium]
MIDTEATRPVLWNISHSWILYVMWAISMVIAGWGVRRRLLRWQVGGRLGLRELLQDRPRERVRRVLLHAVAQRRTLHHRWAAFFHSFLTAGFAVLFVATVVVMLDDRFGIPVMRGAFYLYFQSLLVDLFGGLVLVGVGIAAWRRIRRRGQAKTSEVREREAWAMLALIFALAGTGFLVEGWRIAATGDPWGAWSPLGYLVAQTSRLVMSDGAMVMAHRVGWWLHAGLFFGFLAVAPQTQLLHLLSGPLQIFAARLEPSGAALGTPDLEGLIEKGEPLGVRSLQQFGWQELLSFDACTQCGRCTEVCPANTVGKVLSPRDLIVQLRDLPVLPLSASGRDGEASPITSTVPAASPEALWQCTTCGACMEACPVFIDQMPRIVDLRRYLAMEEADLPETMQAAMTSLETRGHPFRGTQSTRLDWTEGLSVQTPVRTMAEVVAGEMEVLLWVGCGGALIERNQQVVRATAQLLDAAGVRYAVLGREEKCTGDPARRVGNEFLFASLARENIATMGRYGIQTIVTSCPHCFNTLLHEYPSFGGKYEVYHHSEYLARLVAEGRLHAERVAEQTVTFHDPCYLGRHNGRYEAPRQLVQLSSRRTVEMERSREAGFCCGGGGGMSFVDEPRGARVNQERAREALGTGAEVVAVGCPFCMTMLEDGINAQRGDRPVRVLDVAELLWESVRPHQPQPERTVEPTAKDAS